MMSQTYTTIGKKNKKEKGDKMKSKEIIKKIIIILLILILIIIGILVYLYFMTDSFKTNKELFFKYASQIVTNQNSEKELNIDTYWQKKKQTPYTNSGTLTSNFDIQMPEGSIDEKTQKSIDAANNMAINFNGKIDNPNNKTEENITLNYTNDVNFPLKYKHTGDIYAIQSDYFSTQNIAIENNNLKDLFAKLNMDIINIPDKIEIPESENQQLFTTEEQEILKNNYLPVILNNLEETDFTVNKEKGQNTYTLTLTKEKVKNIIEQLLNILKDDEIILDSINSKISTYNNSSKITTEEIEAIIKQIQELKIEEDNPITISLTVKEKLLSEVLINVDNAEIKILYEQDQDNIKTTVTLNMNYPIIGANALNNSSEDLINLKLELVTSYSGLQEMQTVNENYNLNFLISTATSEEENKEAVMGWKYELKNQVNFEENVNIENLNSNNSIILNDYSEEQIQNFINALGQRIQDVNTQQMQEIQFEGNVNPIIYTNPYTFIMVNMIMQMQESINEASNATSKVQIQAFNESFKMYEGEIKGILAKSLLEQISANNAETNGYPIQSTGSITNAEQIDDSGNYEVQFGYDEEGRISEISIDLK